MKYSASIVVFFRISLVIVAVFAAAQLHAQSNEGTEFWFGFMEHRDIGANTRVAMLTSRYDTQGTISVPMAGWSQTFTISANSVTIITLPPITETRGSESISANAVKVVSDLPIAVYIHQYFSRRSEATVVLPTVSLGQDYRVITYTGPSQNNEIYPAEFLIVATQDNTKISVTLSAQTKNGKAPGSSFSITLDAGETYQVQAQASTGDFTGTLVTGDKKFAVFGGNRWTGIPAGCGTWDNLLEQMYPIPTWGKQFVTVPSTKVLYDVFRILAAEDNTRVTVTGSTTTVHNLHAGKFVEYRMSEPTYIQANKPIQVAQFIIGNQCNGHIVGDPSMLLLNSVEQRRDTVTLYNSRLENITENYINIIMSSADVPLITIDNQPISGMPGLGFVGANQDFAYLQIPVASGAHTIISQGCGVIATAYGYGDAESYAYGGGANFKNINLNPIPEGGCLNDTIVFDTGLPESRYSFFWDLGDGTTTDQAVFTHIYHSLGTFPVSLILTDHCQNTSDTLYRGLLVSLRQSLEAYGDTILCEGGAFSLYAHDLSEARYEWRGPLGFFSEQQFPRLTNATAAMSGSYAVEGIISGCATFPQYVQVDVIPTPAPDLGPDTIFCGKEVIFPLDPGEYNSYLWHDGLRQRVYEATQAGVYFVNVTDGFECMGSDTVVLQEVCPPDLYIPDAFTPNDDGHNDLFGIYGQYLIRHRLVIFNRWGKKVFESFQMDDRWDGRAGGSPVPEGVYVWQLEYDAYQDDGSVYTEKIAGTVTLIR
ncbi:MAG: gliding motility-associated C-terminal domain-containing protein [Bacteroidia bacterium]